MLRKRPSIIATEQPSIDLTPMLDVVFIMLIFFIVTASFVKEAGIEVKRPEAQTAIEKKRTSLLIAISPENIVWIDKKKVELGAVKQIVSDLHAENPKGGIVIQADKESNAESLMKVMDAVREAGVKKIAVAAEE